MEKGRGKGTDTLQTDNVFTRKEYIEREAVLALKKPFPTSKNSVTLYQQYFISPTAIEKIPAADVRPVEWIPVTERLPDAGERVLCYCRANIYEVMKMRTDGDWVYDTNHIYMRSFVTHWMPLPEPPKEK